ncbi:MAG: acyloxyacyl hydrolase, partial [Prolixibacteraceae bacterium]|nr:acyloxyacyl hydrolase [Prolixibacteraceae bacterium]
MPPSYLSAADSIKSPVFYSINYRGGQNKPHKPPIKNLVYPYRSVDLKVGWQTQGNKAWHTAYRNPSFGIGFNFASFETDIVGKPSTLYFFTQFPQYNAKWGRMDLEVDLGMSYGINPYNAETNPHNFSTGSTTNVFFGFYLEQSFNLGKHVDVFAAGGFTHYSNGALNYPNYGLNIPSVKVGLRYQPRYSEVYRTKPDFERNFTISTYLGGGTMFIFSKDTIAYNSVLIQPSLNYRVGYKHRVGIGYE